LNSVISKYIITTSFLEINLQKHESYATKVVMKGGVFHDYL